MRRFKVAATGLALATAILAISDSAYAQEPILYSEEIPTFTKSNDAAPPPAERPRERENASVRLRPLALDDVTVGNVVPEGGFAAVVPPAPRLVTRVASRPIGAVEVNSNFGFRQDPITGRTRMHTGVDLRASYGDSIGAALAGRVAYAGYRGGYGNLVIVDHGRGISTYYAHLLSISVSVGQTVVAGQAIGLAGSTGRSTGPHLHYEVRANGIPIDPSSVITFKGTAIFANGSPVRGRAVDGGDEEPARAKDASQPPRPPAPLFQSGDTLSNQ